MNKVYSLKMQNLNNFILINSERPAMKIFLSIVLLNVRVHKKANAIKTFVDAIATFCKYY